MARLTDSQQVMQQMMMPIVFMALVIAIEIAAAKGFWLRAIASQVKIAQTGRPTMNHDDLNHWSKRAADWATRLS